MSIRTDKVSSLIKRTLAQTINELAREYKAGIATVTSVRMTKDLHIAKVYISVYGGKITPGQFLTYLEKRTPEVRSFVGSQVHLRYTPEIRFFIDDTLDQMDRIDGLLKDAGNNNDLNFS